MHLDASTLKQYLETHRKELARIWSEAETARDEDLKIHLQETQAYYDKAMQHLEKGNLVAAYTAHLYLEGFIGVASEEVKRDAKLRDAISNLLNELPSI
jgi:hypothetical protein